MKWPINEKWWLNKLNNVRIICLKKFHGKKIGNNLNNIQENDIINVPEIMPCIWRWRNKRKWGRWEKWREQQRWQRIKCFKTRHQGGLAINGLGVQ